MRLTILCRHKNLSIIKSRDSLSRIDVITVLHKNGVVMEVEHIENAYYPRVRTY